LNSLSRTTPRARQGVIGALVLVAVIGSLVVWARPRLAAEQRWRAIHTRGVLRIGIDPGMRPFSFYGPSGWEGYEADVARELGRQLDLRIEPVQVGYDGFYDALATGQVDVSMSALAPDESRLTTIVYSQPVIDVGVRLMGQADLRYHQPDDLHDKEIGVVLGGEADRSARWIERRVTGVHRVVLADVPNATRSFRLGTIDVVMLDGEAAIANGCPAIATRDGATGMALRCYALQPTPYVMAASRADAPLVEEINSAVDTLQRAGTLDQLARIWFVSKPR